VKRGVFRALGLAFGAALTLAGCAPRETQPPLGGRPAVLRIGYTPSEEAVSDRAAANQALARHLERTIPGLKVTLVRTPSYGPAVEAMSRGEIDLMGLPPFAYVLAGKSSPVEAIAVTGSAQKRSEVIKADDHGPVSNAGGALSIKSEDAEAKVAVGCPLIELAQQLGEIESSSCFDFDVQPRHACHVGALSSGSHGFGIWPPIGGKVLGHNSLRFVAAHFSVLSHVRSHSIESTAAVRPSR
jgi:hypothetical protein